MKKLFTFLMVIALFASCTQAPTYTINGDISGLKGKAYLTHRVDNKIVKADSAELVDGKLMFTGSVEAPELYMITFEKNPRARIQFIIDNSVITIKADLANRKEPVITGSAPQDILNKYQESLKPFQEKNMNLRKEYGEANKANDEAKMKEIVEQFNALQEEMKSATMNFIKTNNKTYAAAVIASQQRLNEADQIDDLVSVLDESLQNTDLVVGMKEKADKLRKVAIGKIIPDFTMNDTEGNPLTLSSLFGKGYLLIDCWASWCGPCRAENPHVVVAYNEYHDKGFEILGVSYDSNKDKWLKAIKDDNLNWLHVSDLKGWQNLTSDLYMVKGIPANFLVDKDGRIVAKNLRGDALKEKLEELLK